MGAERRKTERHAICVPVAFCLFDETSHVMVSERAHGVLTDVSTGGVCLGLIGPIAEQIARIQSEKQWVEVTFLPRPIMNLGPVMCRGRWARRSPEMGWSIGLQFDMDAPRADALVAALLRYVEQPSQGAPRSAWTSWIVAGLTAALAILFWPKEKAAPVLEPVVQAPPSPAPTKDVPPRDTPPGDSEELTNARKRLDSMGQATQSLTQAIEESERELEGVRQELVRCQAGKTAPGNAAAQEAHEDPAH